MSRLIKKSIIKIVDKLPGFNRYLEEKRAMQVLISQQNEHIAILEEANRSAQHYIEKRPGTSPLLRFITNQLDETGAPLIFMDVIRDFKTAHKDEPADLTSFAPVKENYVKEFKDLGYKVNIYDRRDVELKFVKGDVVVLNTVAHSQQLKNSIYNALEGGLIKKLIWYMHEDWPDIFFDNDERQRIRKLINLKKISIYLPATKAIENHEKVYAGKGNIKKVPYHIKLDEQYYINRSESDFNILRFIMVGKTGEGLKGHLPILYAFLTFKQEYYNKSPDSYRDFELSFVAIEADYLSLQILKHATGLGEHFKHYPPLSHKQTLGVIKGANVTICYSLRECLPIFVFEGMSMGHVILRNDVSGMAEQLEDGKNGLFIKSTDFNQVLGSIEQVLNKNKTTNEQLAKMSKRSLEIAKVQQNNNYDKIINEVWDNWRK